MNTAEVTHTLAHVLDGLKTQRQLLATTVLSLRADVNQPEPVALTTALECLDATIERLKRAQSH